MKNDDSFSKQIDDVLSGKYNRFDALKVCDTPRIFLDAGLQQLPILYTQNHLKDALHEKSSDNPHWHGLSIEQIKKVPKLLESPVLLMDSLNNDDSIVAVLSLLDNDNAPVFATIKPNGNGIYNSHKTDSNFMLSIYGKEKGFEYYIKRAVEENKILYWNKEKSQEIQCAELLMAQGLDSLDSNKILHQTNSLVNKTTSTLVIDSNQAARIKAAREIKENMPNLSENERAAAVAILEAGAKSQKMSDNTKQTETPKTRSEYLQGKTEILEHIEEATDFQSDSSYIHSEEFISKFGDWEKAKRLEKLIKSESVQITGTEIASSDNIKEYKRNAIQYGKNLRGEYENLDSGKHIILTSRKKNGGIYEILEHDYKDKKHLQSIAAIPQIIEKSIYISSQKNEDTKKHPNIEKYEYYLCGLKIENKDYTVKAVVAKTLDGKRYYDHKLTDIEKGQLIESLKKYSVQKSSVSITTQTPDNERFQLKDKRLYQICQCPQSIYLDEKLEPSQETVQAVKTGKLYLEKDENGIEIIHDETEYHLKETRSFASERPLVVRGGTQSIPSSTVVNIDGKNNSVNDVSSSLLIRGEISMLRKHPEIKDSETRFQNALNLLEAKSRSEYLHGKTELSDVDIINILDLPVEKRSINNEIYTDKSYKELKNNPEELSSLTENLKTKPEYLKYHSSYIAKSKLLYQESDVLCNEIPCLIVLDQLKKTSYLLPYEYAKNKNNKDISSADSLKSDVFTDFKRVFNGNIKYHLKSGVEQGKDIFFLINNKKLSHDEIKSQLIRFSNNRTSENKEGTFLFFSEKDYICHAFESDKDGFVRELSKHDLKKIRAAISSKPLTPSRESEKTSDSLASNLNITQENSDVNDLKQIRLANVGKPLHPTRSQTEMSATSSDNINLLQNKPVVKEVFQSLLLRGEITLLERKKDIENRNERYLDAVTSLEKLNASIHSETIKKSNSKFIEKECSSKFFKSLVNNQRIVSESQKVNSSFVKKSGLTPLGKPSFAEDISNKINIPSTNETIKPESKTVNKLYKKNKALIAEQTEDKTPLQENKTENQNIEPSKQERSKFDNELINEVNLNKISSKPDMQMGKTSISSELLSFPVEPQLSIGSRAKHMLLQNDIERQAVIKKLNKIKTEKIEPREFLIKLKEAYKFEDKNSSDYVANRINNSRFALRLSNHSVNAYYVEDKYVETSIVIRLSYNEFQDEPNKYVAEFNYTPEMLSPEKKKEIIDNLKTWTMTGQYPETDIKPKYSPSEEEWKKANKKMLDFINKSNLQFLDTGIDTKTSNQLQENKMENTSSENISYENEEMSKAAAIKERNQQKKLTTQMILDQEDKEQMENISATMKSATKDFMDLNATPITEERIDFLKTPTGNKSELSENEWKFSHSSEFKELYGDWEGKIKKDFLLNDDTVSKLTGDEFSRKEGFTLTEQVEQYFNEMNNSVESPFFGKVVLDREGADDSLSHGMRRLKAVAYAGVPGVIKNGVIIDSDLNHKDRGYNSYVIAAPIKIADKNYICEVVLKQNKQENRFYLHEVTEQKKFLERAFVTNPAQKPAHQGTLSNILEKTVSVNYEISCPMGINGEPEKTFVQNEYRKSLDEVQSKNQNTATKITDSVSQEENEKSTDILELQDALKVALKETAVPLEKIDFTRENYNKLFPYSKIETPIEIVKMGANQFEKLEKKERQDILLAVHDTLKNPDLIINEHRENISEKNEDNHIYAKSFLINDKVYGIQSVVVSIDGENVSISTHERNINNIVNKIKKPDQLLFAAAKVRLSVERITGEQLVTVNPIRENEYVVSPQSNIQQNSDSVKQEENPAIKKSQIDFNKEIQNQVQEKIMENNEVQRQMDMDNGLIGENGNEILYDGLESGTGSRRSIKAIDVWNEIYETISENPEYKAIKFAALDYLYNKGTDDAAGYDNSFERNLNRLKEISRSDKQLESILEKYKDYKIDFDDKALAVKIAGRRNNNFNQAKQDLLDFVENKKYLRELEISQKQEFSLFDEKLLQEYKQKYPESSLSISENTRIELENVFSQIDDYLDKGIVPQERRFTLPNVPSYLKELGSNETAISLPVSVIKKARETHGLSNEEIKNSLTRLYDPVAVFDTDKTKSENKLDSKLILTDEFSESKPIALALNTNTQIQVEEDGHRKLIEVQDIRSIHDRTLTAKNGTDLVKHWTENGLCKYVDDKKISEWSTVARVSFPIEALHSDKNNILTKSEVVNQQNSDSVKQEENPSVQMEPRLMKKFDEMKKAIETREKQEGQTAAEKTESAGSKKAESHEKQKVDLIKKAAKDFISAIKNGTAPFLNTTENDFGKILLHPAAIVNASNGLPFSGEAQLLAQIYHQQQKMEGEIVTTFEGAKESGTFIADKPESKKNFVLANKTEQQQKEIIQKTRYFMPEACGEPDKIYAHALQMQRPQKISDYRDLIRHFENIPNGQKEISDLRIRIAHEHLKEIQSRFAQKEKRILTVDEINERKKILQDYFKSLPEKHRESEKSAFENTFGLTLNPEEVFKTNLEGNFKNKKFEDVVKSNEKLTDQANRRLSAFIQNNSMEDKKLSEILHEEYNAQAKEEKSTSKKLKIEAKGITEPETYLGKYLAACSSNAEFVTDEDTIKAVQANLVKKLEENYRLEKYGILNEIGQQAQKISNETTSKIAFDKAHSNKNTKEKNIAKEIGPVGMGN